MKFFFTVVEQLARPKAADFLTYVVTATVLPLCRSGGEDEHVSGMLPQAF